MRIAITGGAGFIGSHIVNNYIDLGHEVLIIDNLSSGRRVNLDGRALFIEADIRSERAANELAAFRPEVLNHHAAQIDVRRSVREPRLDADINVGGTLNCLEACARGGALIRVVYSASGGSMYGDDAPSPTAENAPAGPSSFYGVSKHAAELAIHCFGRLNGVHTVALRYSNVYGPRQDPHGEAGVVAIFSERLLKGEPCSIFGDGLQTRDFVYIGDVVAANVRALDCEFKGGVNICSGVGTTVVDLFARLAAAAKVQVRPTHAPARSGEQRHSVLTNGLARAALSWAPSVSLDQGLQATIAWTRTALNAGAGTR